jgi:hypothetical protein
LRKLWRNLSSRYAYQRSCPTFEDQPQWQGLDVKELQEGHSASIIADDHAALEAIVTFYQQHDGDGKVKDRDIYGRRSVTLRFIPDIYLPTTNVNRNAKPVTELKNAISALYREVIAKPGHGVSSHTPVTDR